MDERLWKTSRRSKRRKATMAKKLEYRKNVGNSWHRSIYRLSPSYAHELHRYNLISKEERALSCEKLIKLGLADYYDEQEELCMLHKQQLLQQELQQGILNLTKDFKAQMAFMFSKLSAYGLEDGLIYEEILENNEEYKETLLSVISL